jgi:IS5 family transposase
MVTTTPASVGDVTEVDKLLHGQEKTVHAHAGYQGARLPSSTTSRPNW